MPRNNEIMKISKWTKEISTKYWNASVFTGICRKNGKEKKHKHSYWINIIYTINLRLLGHCICLKSSANVFWVIRRFSTCCVSPVPSDAEIYEGCEISNIWWTQNISALRTLGHASNPGSLREMSAIFHPSAGHLATPYNTVSFL